MAGLLFPSPLAHVGWPCQVLVVLASWSPGMGLVCLVAGGSVLGRSTGPVEPVGHPCGIHTPSPCSHVLIPRSALCFLVNQMFIVRSLSPGWGWPAAKHACSRPLSGVWVSACWSLQRERGPRPKSEVVVMAVLPHGGAGGTEPARQAASTSGPSDSLDFGPFRVK